MKVGLTYNIKTDWVKAQGEPIDADAEFDKPRVIDDIQMALEIGGHSVERIGNVFDLMKVIDRLDLDIVFNICEGFKGRNRESQVPILLEMHDIPYVGSDALTLGLTLDKVVAKRIFQSEGIPTPQYFSATKNDDLNNLNTIGYPLIVKTRFEGTSKGITERSKVNNEEELQRQVEIINDTYDQPALVEGLIEGTEFTIPVIGNEHPEAMSIIQVSMDGSVDLGDKIYTFARVSDDNLRYICPAEISKDLETKMKDMAIQVYKSVECRDMGRVDFRVDRNGNPFVLEINPLPSLAHNDVFNLYPQTIGSDYTATINKIFDCACARYGLLKDEVVLQGEK